MAKTASAKPLLYPVAHLDDLGQRSKHAFVGNELCLGTLQLHGNGGRGGTALGRARGDNRRDVERLGNVVLKERACLLEHLKRQVLKIAATLLTHQDQMAHHGVCLAERQATLGQVIGNIGSGKVPHAALARHGILVDSPGRNHTGHNGQALHKRMGGQHINKTSSAIRVTHIPTGTVVECQNERSQFQNKDKALEILRSRLLAQKQKEQQDAINAQRQGQVGTGDRSEKIRTYNFPQDRCTDHRIGLTVHNLEKIMDGNLDEVIDALATHEQTEKLQKLGG